jgi:hypothetical protein
VRYRRASLCVVFSLASPRSKHMQRSREQACYINPASSDNHHGGAESPNQHLSHVLAVSTSTCDQPSTTILLPICYCAPATSFRYKACFFLAGGRSSQLSQPEEASVKRRGAIIMAISSWNKSLHA